MRFISTIGIASAVVALGFMATPASAQAASLTQNQIDAVVSLITAFGVDSGTIASVKATLENATTTQATSTVSSKDLLRLKAMLKIGSSGEDVRILQKILASDPSLYPEGLVTGFFGPLTELAVKRLQAKLKIEQAGVVGPQTLAKINDLLTGITADDLANSRVKIEIKIKDGKEEIKFEVKDDNSGKSTDDDGDDADDDNDQDEDDDEDDEDGDEDEDDDN